MIDISEGWMLPEEVFDWINGNVVAGSLILEFGSGNGSKILSKKYDLISIEHDKKWLNMSIGRYIHAEIIENHYSTEFSQKGWYNSEKITDLPSSVELIIVDGPPGEIGRAGILDFLNNLPTAKWILVDDTDRPDEKALLIRLIQLIKPLSLVNIISKSKRGNGNYREATVLKMGWIFE